MNVFIGIDVSKLQLEVCWLQDVSTNKHKSAIYANTLKGRTQLGDWLKKRLKVAPDAVKVIIEPTGVYHEALLPCLHQLGFGVIVVNPGKANHYAKSRCQTHKTDKQDALMLARYGYACFDTLSLWQPEPQEATELKMMLRRLSALEKDLQREQNRLEALTYCLSSTYVEQSLKEMIKALEKSIKQLSQLIDQHIDQNPQLKHDRQLLESIKGIGPVMSRELVCLFLCKSFKNARQVAAYLGLIPKHKESGLLKGRTVLSKTGDARIRAKLYRAAVSACQHNPDIQALRERLIKARKTPMQALGAAMRKLVQICFGVIKHQCEYQPQLATI